MTSVGSAVGVECLAEAVGGPTVAVGGRRGVKGGQGIFAVANRQGPQER